MPLTDTLKTTRSQIIEYLHRRIIGIHIVSNSLQELYLDTCMQYVHF